MSCAKSSEMKKASKELFFFFPFLNELLREQLAILIFATQRIYFSMLVTEEIMEIHLKLIILRGGQDIVLLGTVSGSGHIDTNPVHVRLC